MFNITRLQLALVTLSLIPFAHSVTTQFAEVLSASHIYAATALCCALIGYGTGVLANMLKSKQGETAIEAVKPRVRRSNMCLELEMQ
jgi:hypothetical protein